MSLPPLPLAGLRGLNAGLAGLSGEKPGLVGLMPAPRPLALGLSGEICVGLLGEYAGEVGE